MAAPAPDTGSTTVLRPEGNLTMADYLPVQEKLEADIPWGEDLVIDLGGIGDVDSVALVVFIGVVRKMHFNGGSVRFACLPPGMTGLIDLYEVDEFFRKADRE